MRVLLTRAADDAARTRATLESLGHRVLVSPVIEIVPLAPQWPGGLVDGILATSGQAFSAIADSWGPLPEARRLLPLWLVGARTHDVARQRGFSGSSFIAPNAISLALEMNKRLGSHRVVYLAGRDRKPDIETALAVTKQAVAVVELYEARPTAELTATVRDNLSAGSIDAVLHFSRRSAALFHKLLTTTGMAAPSWNICLSADVAAPLLAAGWSADIAAEPTERSLFEMLETST